MILLSQAKRLTLTQTMVEMIKQIRSMPETEVLGHLVGFYVYAAREMGATREQAIEALNMTWEEKPEQKG